MKKLPSKVAYFSFCSAVLVLPKSARSAQTLDNSHSFFNVSYTNLWKKHFHLILNLILNYCRTKNVKIMRNHIVLKNWMQFKNSCDLIVSYWNLVSPYFLLVFLWPRFLSFSFATFNRSQEELFLCSLANNSDAKHLFKATFVIPEGRHYYILQRYFFILLNMLIHLIVSDSFIFQTDFL